MNIQASLTADGLVFRLSGEIDHYSVQSAFEFIESTLSETPAGAVALDFAEVSFMDTSGLALIIKTGKAVGADVGGLSVINANTRIRQILDVAGLSSAVLREDAQ
ncbi:MAG: STAS domain-containing protein [Oscillospiraceae bacterium]|jgi:stage II sporulation protein AA (anti-sigma F factor antagonist)|nr:STAS domain-containing protein [Oscillospiraceae bacterium]